MSTVITVHDYQILAKKGKPFFHGRARCRIVARAQAPEPAAPEACQRATTGDSGRWPLSERPPIRSLGPVLCTGRVSRSSCRLAAEGQLVVLDQGGERHRALPVAVHLYALARGQWCAADHPPSGAWRPVEWGAPLGLAP